MSTPEALELPPEFEALLWVDAYYERLRAFLTRDATEGELQQLDSAIALIERRITEKPRRTLCA